MDGLTEKIKELILPQSNKVVVELRSGMRVLLKEFFISTNREQMFVVDWSEFQSWNN